MEVAYPVRAGITPRGESSGQIDRPLRRMSPVAGACCLTHRVPRSMTALKHVSDRYDPDGDVNLAGFSASLATYAISLAALVAVGRTTGRAPERYLLGDLV